VVVAAVEEHFRDTKVHVFKKKVRKRYTKLKGHRSQITALRILQVGCFCLGGEGGCWVGLWAAGWLERW